MYIYIYIFLAACWNPSLWNATNKTVDDDLRRKAESQTVALDEQNTLFEDKCDEVGRLKDLLKDSLKIGVKEALSSSCSGPYTKLSTHASPYTRKLDSDTVRYRAVECFSFPCLYFLEFGCMPCSMGVTSSSLIHAHTLKSLHLELDNSTFRIWLLRISPHSDAFSDASQKGHVVKHVWENLAEAENLAESLGKSGPRAARAPMVAMPNCRASIHQLASIPKPSGWWEHLAG